MTTTAAAKTNEFVGSNSEQTYDDALAKTLGRIAYSVPKRQNRTSRFWFKMDLPSTKAQRKKASAPKKLDHIDSQIETRLDRYKQMSPRMFQGNIQEIREFFLTEIAPKTLSVSGGTTQAAEVLRRMLDTDIDASTAQRFTNMVNRASTLKMAQFVAKYFNLDPTFVDAIIGTPVHGGAGGGTTAHDLKFVLDHVTASTKAMEAEIKSLKRRLDDGTRDSR